MNRASNGEGSRKEDLLDEAAAELNARGETQTSLAEIAKRLGVTRAALYYYVRDQEDLVFQCYRRSCEITARRLARAKREARDPIDCINNFIDAMLTSEEPEIAAIAELGFLGVENRDTISGLLDGIASQLGRIIENGIKGKLLRPCATAVAARSILAIVSWPVLLRRSNPDLGDKIVNSLAVTVKELLAFGIAADRSVLPELDVQQNSEGRGIVSNVFAPQNVANAKKEALLAAGSQILNAKGIAATSLDEIALSFGVSKAVIYHNVGDKTTFIEECSKRSFQLYFAIAKQMMDSDASRLSAAASAVYHLCRLSLSDAPPLVIPLVGFEALPKTTVALLRQQSKDLLSVWKRVLNAGMSERTVRKLDAELLIVMTPGLYHWVFQRDLDLGKISLEEIAEEIALLWSVGLIYSGREVEK